MKVNKALEEVWRWKDEVRQEIDGMTSEERVAYFKQASKRLEQKTGVSLDLPRATRRG